MSGSTPAPVTTMFPDTFEEDDQPDQVVSSQVEPAAQNSQIKTEDEKKISIGMWIFYVVCMIAGFIFITWLGITIYEWWTGTSSHYGGGVSTSDIMLTQAIFSMFS